MARAPTTPRTNKPAVVAERRQLTVLFADLMDSTRFSSELDPEDWDDILRAYQRRCAETIEAAGGIVAEIQGDGVVGFFGYANASESDAERSVRAGLALCEAIPNSPPAHGVSLGVRVGIATGLVVTDNRSLAAASAGPGAVGQTMNMAARLQSLATRNAVIVADTTRRLTGSRFAWQDHGRVALKGFTDPVQVWQVIGSTLVGSRVHAASGASSASMVGRQAEMNAVLDAWREARSGKGRVVQIVGDAGLGKSRFVAEFRGRISTQRHAWIEDGGSQFFSGTPFHPVSQMIRRVIDPGGARPPARFRARLAHALKRCDVSLSNAVPVFADMLDLPLDRGTSFALPQTVAKRALLLSALLDWVRGAARSRPLVIVFEDMHWADASSLEVIGQLADAITSMPVLLLTTTRPLRRPGAIAPDTLAVHLKPLPDLELREVVRGMAAAATSLTPQDLDRVIQRAGGVPLFGVELAHLLREQGGASGAPGSSSEDEVPTSIADLLMARLDQLGAAKSVAQLAAVIGTQVPREILVAIADLPESTLRSHLATLKSHNILGPTDRQGAVYAFRHAMLRDAAYGSLLKSRRRDLHRAAAMAIREGDSGSAASKADLLAYHWTNAGEIDAAIDAWTEAGRYASDRHAFIEAENAFGAALAAVLKQLATPERDRRELALQSSYANALRVTRGMSAPPTIKATRRARDLADRSGDSEQQLSQAWGSWAAASSGGDFEAGRLLANRFEQLAFANGLTRHLAAAQMMQMTSRFRVGDIGGAEDAFQQGTRFFDDADFRSKPGFVAQTYGNAAMIAWTLGDDNLARQRIEGALVCEHHDDRPFDTVYGLLMYSVYLTLVEAYDEAARCACDSAALCDKFGIAQFSASTRIVLGRAKVGLGAAEEGAALIREGIAEMQAKGVRVAMTRYLTWLAEGHFEAGRLDAALASANESLTMNPSEFFCRPESLRTRGLILWKLGRRAEAEQDFLGAEQMARHMGAARHVQRARDSLRSLRLEPS